MEDNEKGQSQPGPQRFGGRPSQAWKPGGGVWLEIYPPIDDVRCPLSAVRCQKLHVEVDAPVLACRVSAVPSASGKWKLSRGQITLQSTLTQLAGGRRLTQAHLHRTAYSGRTVAARRRELVLVVNHTVCSWPSDGVRSAKYTVQ
jgi:hypothetical protein